MQQSQIITVYEDPITRKKSEGKAKLVELLLSDDISGLELWKVSFLDDHERYSNSHWILPERRGKITINGKEIDIDNWIAQVVHIGELFSKNRDPVKHETGEKISSHAEQIVNWFIENRKPMNWKNLTRILEDMKP